MVLNNLDKSLNSIQLDLGDTSGNQKKTHPVSCWVWHPFPPPYDPCCAGEGQLD